MGLRRRRPRLLLTVTTLVLVPAALLAGGLHLSVTSRLDRIDGAFEGLSGRPAAAPGTTLLMIGTRPGGSGDVTWLAGTQSIESLSLVEIDAGGPSVRVRSLPLAVGAEPVASVPPSETVAAVESWSGHRVDHLLAVDWRVFATLASDNGVDVSYDYGSPPPVQHDYLRHVLEGTLHTELRKQPDDLLRALSTTASGTAVDEEWSALAMGGLLFSLRDLRSRQIEFSMARRS